MRRSSIRRRNDARAASERVRQFGDLRDYVVTLRCAIPGCAAWAVPAHVRTRRNHGAWLELDDGQRVGNIANLCDAHHREQHRIGVRTFERRYGVDLAEIAAARGREFLQGTDPGAPW